MNREQRLAKRERMKQLINLEILGDYDTLSEMFKDDESPLRNFEEVETFVRLAYKQIPNELIAEILELSSKELTTLINKIQLNHTKFYYSQELDMIGNVIQFSDYWDLSWDGANFRLNKSLKHLCMPVKFDFEIASQVERVVCPTCDKMRLKRSSKCPNCAYQKELEKRRKKRIASSVDKFKFEFRNVDKRKLGKFERSIVEDRLKGMSYDEISKKHDITPSRINRILNEAKNYEAK